MMTPALTLLLAVIGNSFLMSFISLHLGRDGLQSGQVGVIHSLFYLGILISSLRSEHVIARIGHIRALTATCGVLGSSALSLVLVPVEYWPAVRLVAGLATGCFYVGVESWFLAEASPERRGQVLALYTMVLYSGQTVAQSILGQVGKNLAFATTFAGFMACLAVIPVSIGRRGDPASHPFRGGNLLELMGRSPLGLTGSFIAGLILSSFYSFMPLFFQSSGRSPARSMATVILGGTLLGWPIGKMSDHLGRRRTLLFVSVLTILFLGAVPSIGIASLLDPVWMFLLGGAMFSIYPVSMSLGCDCVGSEDLVRMTGALLFVYGAGAVLGPMLSPLLGSVALPTPLPAMMVFCSVLFVISLYMTTTRAPVPAGERTPFTLVPPSVAMVEELYPAAIESPAGEKPSTDI